MKYKRMLKDVLRVTYGMYPAQAKEAIRNSTISEALNAFPDVLMHDSVENTARIVYLKYFSNNGIRPNKRFTSKE